MIDTPIISHSKAKQTAVIHLTIPRAEIQQAMAPAPAGRVKPGQLPAGKIARTVFHGNYDRIGAAWGEFDAWIKAAGHAAGAELWERYVKGPESSADPAAWETELSRPLVK